MKKILMLGMSPLPTENEMCTLGPGKRTWQFAKALLPDGHRIVLVCSRHLAAYKSENLFPIIAEEHDNLIYYSVDQNVFESVTWLQNIHDRFEPDCIVGATVFPTSIAAQLKTNAPIWGDLFGHLMAEAQTKSYVFNDNYYISRLWNLEQIVLDKVDVFSVVSTPQAYATIGELGTRGRLNAATRGYEFIHIIPCSINEPGHILSNETSCHFRGKYFSSDDFIILWSGGYNTWTDVHTLFKALECVFEKHNHVKFVSTGGQIESHDDLTYSIFQNMIESSKYKDHFILLGWIPFSQVPMIWKESNIGINIDLFSYEALLGSRNRILDWMQIGLPVLTTDLCELSKIIKKNKLGFTFEPENYKDLTAMIEWILEHPDEMKNRALKAKEYVISHYSIQKTTAPLRNWANNPEYAPDRNTKFSLRLNDKLISGINLSHYIASLKNQFRHQGISEIIRKTIRKFKLR